MDKITEELDLKWTDALRFCTKHTFLHYCRHDGAKNRARHFCAQCVKLNKP